MRNFYFLIPMLLSVKFEDNNTEIYIFILKVYYFIMQKTKYLFRGARADARVMCGSGSADKVFTMS